MKVAIFGDSFGVSKEEDEFPGWPALLAQDHQVKNFCQCGASQYKILKQLVQVDLSVFDRMIVTHTSFSRVFVRHNPLHSQTRYHKDCDIILSDIESFDNEFADACRLYFKHIYDDEFQRDIYQMIGREIDDLCGHRTIHIAHLDHSPLYRFQNSINFHELWIANRGSVGHYNKVGNVKIYEEISRRLYG